MQRLSVGVGPGLARREGTGYEEGMSERLQEGYSHIELFAGCGGMSLGLTAAGFRLVLANELSPMAAETFAFNILGVTFAEGEFSPSEKLRARYVTGDSVRWLNSRHEGRESVRDRLRENPNEATARFEEMDELLDVSNPRLLVGSLVDLNRWLADPKDSGSGTRKRLRELRIDLVSGGPPCQSFSLAGLRDRDNPRNRLPMEFAEFVDHCRPRLVLLENVSGILLPFKDKQTGERYVAALEVAKAFAGKDYLPICLHINAASFGVAQSRPRFVMFAVNAEVLGLQRREARERQTAPDTQSDAGGMYGEVKKLFPPREGKGVTSAALESAIKFWEDVQLGKDVTLESILQIQEEKKPKLLADFSSGDVDAADPLSWLKSSAVAAQSAGVRLRTVKQAIDDLRGDSPSARDPSCLSDDLKLPPPAHWAGSSATEIRHLKVANHQPRRNGPKVRARFRLYKAIRDVDVPADRRLLEASLRDPERRESILCKLEKRRPKIWRELADTRLLTSTGEEITSNVEQTVRSLFAELATRKQVQMALTADQPAPAALSIPDDACHYHDEVDRTLTVREMARIQSFPDWFEFRNKVTTGGSSRRYEVPQYTQVGNAVPPLMARGLGQVAKALLDLLPRVDAPVSD
jgi:DNA (cytosine-5)-methyltransferase 1